MWVTGEARGKNRDCENVLAGRAYRTSHISKIKFWKGEHSTKLWYNTTLFTKIRTESAIFWTWALLGSGAPEIIKMFYN
jgi:hypothetical protein